MSEGKVKWFNPRKGYGFISNADGTDVFVHYSNISSDGYRTLAEDDLVTFDVVEGEKGMRAENVVLKSPAESEAPAESKAPAESEAPAENKASAESEASTESE